MTLVDESESLVDESEVNPLGVVTFGEIKEPATFDETELASESNVPVYLTNFLGMLQFIGYFSESAAEGRGVEPAYDRV